MGEAATFTTRAVTLGVRIPNSGPLCSSDNIISVATRAQELGYDQLWVHDHISWPQEQLTHFAAGSIEICRDQPSNFFESIATVTFLAGRLDRIKVGIAGLVAPLRDPRVMAKQLTTVEQLSGSRVSAVFGVGAIRNDFEVMGVPFNRRGRISNDYLAALRTIMSVEPPVNFESDTVSFTNGTFLPRPDRLEILVAGGSDAARARAAKYGDGWMTVYVDPDTYRQQATQVRELAASHGKDPDCFGLAFETFVCVEDSHDQAVKTAAASLEFMYGSVEKGVDVCLIGSAEEVFGKIERYAAAGVDHVELKFICRSRAHLIEMLERLAAVRPGATPADRADVAPVSG